MSWGLRLNAPSSSGLNIGLQKSSKGGEESAKGFAVPVLKGMEYTKVPGTCSAALLYHRGKWSALNTPSLSSAVRKSLRKEKEWSWAVKDYIHQGWWRLWVLIRDDERWDSLIREVISRNEQIDPWQTSSCPKEGDLHSFVWIPVELKEVSVHFFTTLVFSVQVYIDPFSQ